MATQILRDAPNIPDVGPTPEQVKQQRELAAQLLNPANRQQALMANGTAYFSPFMGMNNMAQQLLGQGYMNRSNQQQQQAIGQQGQQAGDIYQQRSNPIVQQLLGQTAPASAPGQSAQTSSFAGAPNLQSAILMQESGNNPNVRPSVSGAVGPGQIMPATFSQFAKPGENIANPTDNTNVSGRILEKYMQDYGDPARAAVAYFSGPGNVAPAGSPTPWKRDVADPTGKTVSSYVSDIQRRLGGQQQQPQQTAQVDPQLLGRYEANPWANDASKARVVGQQVDQALSEDVYGRPTVTSAQGGVRGLPIGGGVTPGFRAPATVSPEGAVSTTIPQAAPGQIGQGGQGAQGLQEALQPLMNVGKNFGQQGAANKATRGQVEQDVQSAYNNIPIQQTLQTMKDDILSHGDKMIWGPTADWVNNLRRGIAQHAPGLMNQKDLEGLASADSFEKLSAQLQTLVGRQVGSTDASLFQGMKSVPGSHNSKEGALALIDMLNQVVKLSGQFMVQSQYKIGQPGFDYLAEKNKFFENNPIVNPISNNPIRLDLQKGSSHETRMINGKTYTKIDGIWHEGM